jgi:6-pyruvoyltetrahydropterin/6-carboxytetrahydropterin synthase
MPKLMIVKKFEFGAAHRLPKYNGPCNRLHGHNWIMEVGITGPVDIHTGMIMDFKDLKGVINEAVVNFMDHRYMNDKADMPFNFPCDNPTAENMMAWIVNTLQIQLPLIDQSLELALVRLWETSGSYCEWRT